MKIRDRIRELRRVRAGDLAPNPLNWRKHPEAQANALRGLLAEIGFAGAALAREMADGSLQLIDGHLRTETVGPDVEIPVLVLDVNAEEASKILATFDPISAMAETDAEMLGRLMAEVSFESSDVNDMLDGLLGEEEQEPSAGNTDPDEIPEVPVEPKTKPGDIWVLGSHRLICGDSTRVEDIDRLMAGEAADLWLTDPPYNVAYVGKTKDSLTIDNDSMEDEAFRAFLAGAFANAFHAMRAGASFYIWHADSEGFNFRGAVRDCGQRVRQCLVWNKNSMVMGRQDYHWKHEPCLYGWKDGAAHSWYADRSQTTVLDFTRPSRSEDHPTMNPVDLFAYQIKNSSKAGDIVLDTFLGSGTTIIAAEQTGRRCFGVELSPAYCDVIVRRWEEFTGRKAVLESPRS